MDKNRIINYVMKTPENTNPNVLSSLLDSEMDNRFVVTLTITDSETIDNDIALSGTMDKTSAQITEAYESGQQIVAKTFFNNNVNEMFLRAVSYEPNIIYPTFLFEAPLVSWNSTVVNKTNDSIVVIPFSETGEDQIFLVRIISLI